MRSLKIHLTWALAIIAVSVVFAYQTHAVERAARPSAVATVNLETVFDSLEEKKFADESLLALAEKLKLDGDELATIIDELNEELEAYPPGSEKHQQTLERLQLASLEYQAQIEFSRRKIDVEKALMLIRIYRGMKDAAKILAEEIGYDIVFVDDSVAELANGSQAEVRRQISARRMLYTNQEIDVTPDLIGRMNNQFQAQAGS